MTEKLLHYIWQFQYYNRNNLKTTEGEELEIIFPGTLNSNQGPDFSEARIKIGKTLFAGSVELHINTSDWDKHSHSKDSNYNNVILHVVFKNDKASTTELPTLELESRVSSILLEKYQTLMNHTSFIACERSTSNIKEITWLSWKERLVAERLTRKSNRIFQLLGENSFHWEETFWWLLARNFGIKINAEAFEELARTITINTLAKHKQQIHQLEALLFGQAGLLNNSFNEDYPQLLKREYLFLQKKLKLQPIHSPIYFLRMRPGNFPTIRLAQLAMLVYQSNHLFSKIVEVKDVQEIKEWLQVTANDYWHYHYQFDEPSDFKPKRLGAEMIDNLIINTVVPMLFAYGLYHKDESLKTKALHWLEDVKPENNFITKGFKSLSIPNTSAFHSQSLIELKNEYCNNKRCLECAIGNAVLKAN